MPDPGARLRQSLAALGRSLRAARATLGASGLRPDEAAALAEDIRGAIAELGRLLRQIDPEGPGEGAGCAGAEVVALAGRRKP